MRGAKKKSQDFIEMSFHLSSFCSNIVNLYISFVHSNYPELNRSKQNPIQSSNNMQDKSNSNV